MEVEKSKTVLSKVFKKQNVKRSSLPSSDESQLSSSSNTNTESRSSDIEDSGDEFFKEFNDIKEDRKSLPKNPHKRRGAPYRRAEDLKIVAWVSVEERYMRTGGRDLWKCAADKRISGEDRTWQSLKERFLKHILPNLHVFITDKQLIKEMEKYFKFNRKQKTDARSRLLWTSASADSGQSADSDSPSDELNDDN